jgi:putative restriction endonuclease
VALPDVTRDSVLAAIAEYDQLGQDAFLATYGFRPARKFVLLLDGKSYDSKALIGAAHRHATGEALAAAAFSGGERTVVARLTALGFDVRDTTALPGADTDGTIGEVPGVEQGQAFASRQELREHGVHRALQAGIVGTGRTGPSRSWSAVATKMTSTTDRRSSTPATAAVRTAARSPTSPSTARATPRS